MPRTQPLGRAGTTLASPAPATQRDAGGVDVSTGSPQEQLPDTTCTASLDCQSGQGWLTGGHWGGIYGIHGVSGNHIQAVHRPRLGGLVA